MSSDIIQWSIFIVYITRRENVGGRHLPSLTAGGVQKLQQCNFTDRGMIRLRNKVYQKCVQCNPTNPNKVLLAFSMCYSFWQSVSMCYSFWQPVRMCYSCWQSVSMCYSFWQHVRMCFSFWQPVHMCYSFWQTFSMLHSFRQPVSM